MPLQSLLHHMYYHSSAAHFLRAGNECAACLIIWLGSHKSRIILSSRDALTLFDLK